MCYNLVTRCVNCERFIDSSLQKCRENPIDVRVHCWQLKMCPNSKTVNGSPVTDQGSLLPVFIDVPDYGELRMHGMRVLTALCSICDGNNPRLKDPNSEQSVLDECNHVYQPVGHDMLKIGTILEIKAKILDDAAGPEDIYFVFFGNLALDQWLNYRAYGLSRRPRIDSRQEMWSEAEFPFSARRTHSPQANQEQDQLSHLIEYFFTRENIIAASQPAPPAVQQNDWVSSWNIAIPPTVAPYDNVMAISSNTFAALPQATLQSIDAALSYSLTPAAPTPQQELTANAPAHLTQPINIPVSRNSFTNITPVLSRGTSAKSSYDSLPILESFEAARVDFEQQMAENNAKAQHQGISLPGATGSREAPIFLDEEPVATSVPLAPVYINTGLAPLFSTDNELDPAAQVPFFIDDDAIFNDVLLDDALEMGPASGVNENFTTIPSTAPLFDEAMAMALTSFPASTPAFAPSPSAEAGGYVELTEEDHAAWAGDADLLLGLRLRYI